MSTGITRESALSMVDALGGINEANVKGLNLSYNNNTIFVSSASAANRVVGKLFGKISQQFHYRHAELPNLINDVTAVLIRCSERESNVNTLENISGRVKLARAGLNLLATTHHSGPNNKQHFNLASNSLESCCAVLDTRVEVLKGVDTVSQAISNGLGSQAGYNPHFDVIETIIRRDSARGHATQIGTAQPGIQDDNGVDFFNN